MSRSIPANQNLVVRSEYNYVEHSLAELDANGRDLNAMILQM